MSNFSSSLPKYSFAIAQLIREVRNGLTKTDPLLGQIRTTRVTHRGTTRQVSQPVILDTKRRKNEVKTLVDIEMFLDTDSEKFTNYLWNWYEVFSSQSKTHLFELISKLTDATSNNVNLSGRNIWDACIEMMAQTKIRFDENGNHNYQFYFDLDVEKKLKETPLTPEQERKWEEIISAKREEYYAQKRTRRLS